MTLQPVATGETGDLELKIRRAVAEGALGPGAVVTGGHGYVRIVYDVPASEKARLVPLARYEGEFWLNARVDGVELREVRG